MQELLRVVALYLCEPHLSTMVTTTRLFQQSYYLGIGWGAAEAFWGITRGWFSGVRLWSDLLDEVSVEPVADPERNMSTSTAQDYATATSQQMESEVVVADDQSSVSSLEDEEDNLLAKIEALQRLRGRKGGPMNRFPSVRRVILKSEACFAYRPGRCVGQTVSSEQAFTKRDPFHYS
jgi:hypothetical protein